MTNKLRCYVISMNEDRLKKFYNQSYTANVEHFPAVVGRNLTPEQIEAEFDVATAEKVLKRHIGLAEIGCSLSHFRLYHKIANDTSINDQDFVMIFEDDSKLKSDWLEVAQSVIKKVKSIPAIQIIKCGMNFTHSHSPISTKERSANTLGFNPKAKQPICDVNGIIYSLHPVFQIRGAGSECYLIRKQHCRKLTKRGVSARCDWLADFFGLNRTSLQSFLILTPTISLQDVNPANSSIYHDFIEATIRPWKVSPQANMKIRPSRFPFKSLRPCYAKYLNFKLGCALAKIKI